MNDVNYMDPGDMPAQTASWTCSACSLAWMNRALGIGVGTSEYEAVAEIGNPEHINATWGLMDASGTRLAQCLIEQGAPSFTCWPSWEQAFVYARDFGLLLGGVNWCHWVVGRAVTASNIVVANSAPGWMGIHDQLTEEDYNRLGPFAAVVTPINYSFPPPAA